MKFIRFKFIIQTYGFRHYITTHLDSNRALLYDNAFEKDI